ncbi:hypothetical protein FGO68_gene17286 [Halteria grandinella]|uniref:Uncharacterized protein n=1 Tax=Halteria grandinella TaxID=5974 RepID=A0A8J8T4S2_HALGN|nr:hypothetical protein FGO68_gene17286 [Halteria grandinella]
MSKTWVPVNQDLANIRGTLDPIKESKIKNKFVRVANNSPDYYSSDQDCLKITSECTILIASVLELLLLRLSKNLIDQRPLLTNLINHLKHQRHFLFSVDIQSLDQRVLKNSVSLKRLQKDVQLLRIARSILQDEKDQAYRESTIDRLKQMNERYQRISRKLKKGSVRMSSEAIDKNRSDIATEEIITQEETIANQDSIQQRQLDEAQSRNYQSLIGTSLPAAESFIRQGPSDYRLKKNRKLAQSANKPRNNQTFFYRTQYRPDPLLTQSHQYEYAQHFNTKALNMDQRITYQSQNQEDSRTTEPETNSCLYRSRPVTSGLPFDGIPILTPEDRARPSDESVPHKRRRVKTAGTRNLPETLSSSKLTRMSKNLLCYVQDQPKIAPILLSQFSRKIMRQRSPSNEKTKFRKRELF